LSALPLAAVDEASFIQCVKGASVWRFLLLDVVLVLVYAWFLFECFRWSNRCLGLPVVRRFTRRWGKRLILLGAGFDIAENVAIGLAHLWPERLRLLVFGFSTAKLAFLLPAFAVAAIVLLAGARRFALPWTVPPSTPPCVPSGDPEINPAIAATVSQAGTPNHTRWYVDAH
jgi:hypothetical protein